MAVYFVKGDLFLTNCNSICHGVNSMGKMGAGIALEIRRRYPGAYNSYVHLYESGQLSIGNVYPYIDSKVIFNMTTQKYYGRTPGVQYASIENIEKGFKKLPKIITKVNESLIGLNREVINGVAFSRIGCSLGGLQWEDVKPLFQEYLGDTVPIIVYEEYISGEDSNDIRYIAQ